MQNLGSLRPVVTGDVHPWERNVGSSKDAAKPRTYTGGPNGAHGSAYQDPPRNRFIVVLIALDH